ncbi:FKBP-type peptidyl-prolyl cis-trans isomerase [Paraflavitalea speifideaquila]|uniref:FKBP-type peptidyl-prolyl cis-trans isomerase n=1 Tax=Paraflavitalea speifideaquila TaxID=3076558 RepID=UPI0028E95852|nr:FKBP-type peptidyl-prolyl cis-trans isomerase [Paraflavitalea speifideiaquila]
MRLFNLAFCMVLGVALFGCNKKNKDQGCATAEENDAKMQAYITANSITATKHATGMYYQIIEPGSGVTPTLNSTVKANYTGKYTNNTSFDSRVASFPLGGVIPGWQVGIPLIRKGGKIKLIVPPNMAYGCYDYQGIPGNSVLVFDVELLEVN